MKIIYHEIGLPQAFLSKSPENGVKLLNWLIDQMQSKPSIKLSIKNICITTRLNERTVQRWLRKFKEWGIITKEQKYGFYSHNTITLNRIIFKYAKYLKYQLDSLWRYLFFVYKSPKPVSVTPYIEEDVINNNSNSNSGSTTHAKVSEDDNWLLPDDYQEEIPPKLNNFSEKKSGNGHVSTDSSSISGHLTKIFKNLTNKIGNETRHWQNLGNGMVKDKKGYVKCIEDVNTEDIW